MSQTRIIGLDPGLRFTGWGVIDVAGTRLIPVAHGVVSPPQKESMAERLSYLFSHLKEVIKTHQPQESAVEETFVNKNPASTLKLGQARGVVLLTPAFLNVPVAEYSANQIKKSVVGAGHASKEQVITMIQHIMPTAGTLTSDAADAMAVAVCHAHHRMTQQKWQAAGGSQ